MHLLPSTNKTFKRTFRHFFRRRMTQMERPVLIITFQGVLGDFFKDSGISNKQDAIMSRQYLQQLSISGNDSNATHLWFRTGSIEGLRYLARHFQIVIFNRDTCFEDHGAYSQIDKIQHFLLSNDIPIDAIYSNQKTTLEPSPKKTTGTGPKSKKQQIRMPEPKRPNDLWEDYK